MICPLCEHQQDQGVYCDVCGKQLSDAAVVARALPTMAELEPTAISDGNPSIPVTRLPELMKHRQAAVTVAVETLPGLEPTLAEKIVDPEEQPANHSEQPPTTIELGEAEVVPVPGTGPAGPGRTGAS